MTRPIDECRQSRENIVTYEPSGTAGVQNDPGTISIRDVSLAYRGLGESHQAQVLADVSLDVAKGEFVCIVGPSGCGKTSLLHCIAGLLKPSRGGIYVGGTLVDGPGRDRGVVFQQYALFPWLSAVRNVEFALEMRGMERKQRREVALEYLRLVDMEKSADVLPKALSGGMKQRVALARAYAAEPQVLLMDEPFGALDAQTRRRLQVDLLSTWERKPRTVVFITHDVEEAVLLGRRVIVMKASPGEVVTEIGIDLGSSRDNKTLDLPAFADYKAVVGRALASVQASRDSLSEN